ncbi:MAG: hydrogenase maturation protease [Burkholderiaceae bacterium]|jgi:hydrogenase maturation protease|nr:hydrogenase maturation protease [Burkholderiaceae bacterium]
MQAMAGDTTILVLGLGNRLLGDDAAGPLVVDRMAGGVADAHTPVRWRDGGTMGLALLPEIEGTSALIAVDAARFGAEPGTVRVFEGAAMDAQLRGRHHSAHELALGDLLGAAALSGCLPEHRALVAVEPQSTSLSLAPSAPVAEALPRLCHEVQRLIERWRARHGHAAHNRQESDA